ncbi:MAG: hypothetical protein A2900_03310 [Candidatus Chisholmbacteria bacterium RIFCSPLOWO2_01_FULL_50_28]|uniref:Glycosyl transferase family 1 domain-containing protein n=1 Tax=Candidatus Chisholmbacteria bacterium RIFCSPHIGHO2_01_FULL_52_32 TaxID=1797591 RepID=A0A1G1VT74_9BACT|nr:MAG: hypothetical protein A2786_03435 [Candidatus Chisholmbacteria bacterium RIFCSPHIGHO2_01_FULL_52_32]OGY20105.1 MAG: hypothetical protein A2900_03310 [Candidatus Chisholmbacteria bacterium RIFCSPLOWO2_01_FULL_50_28]
MHIAVVAADLLPERLGGAEVHVVELIKRLAERDHTFDVFVGHSTEIAKTFPHNVTIHPIKFPEIPNLYGLSYIMFAPIQIKRVLRGKSIDLVWAKQVFPQGVVAAILAGHLKRPLYMTAQNPLDYKEELVMKGLIPFKNLLPNLLTPLVSFALKRADVVACVSRYAKEQADKLGARRSVIIPNGVDTTKFKPSYRAQVEEVKSEKLKVKRRVRIITTSALIPRNGLDTLIDAVYLLPSSLNWELVIAGDGPLYNNLKLQISKYKLEQKVKLLGRVENRKIPQLLAGADLFIRLSRKEGFGVSFLEAMAIGLPVIATPIGGITDFINDGETGLLVEPDRPKEAAKAMERILTDAALYQKHRTNGRILVQKRYTWDHITDQVENMLTSISDGRVS